MIVVLEHVSMGRVFPTNNIGHLPEMYAVDDILFYAEKLRGA
jgi:hypothetical protein